MANKGINLKHVIDVKGTDFCSLSYESAVKLPGGKKNLLQGRVTKVTTGVNCMLFSNQSGSAYQQMVRRRQLKEGKSPDFEVQPRAWGTRIGNTPFIEHKGKHYLDVIVKNKGTSQYFLDGKPVNTKRVEEDGYTFTYLVDDKDNILSEASPKVKINPESQGGIDDKVDVRSISIDNIIELKYQKATLTKVYYAD